MKVWPNGEISVYRPHRQATDSVRVCTVQKTTRLMETAVRCFGALDGFYVCALLGLSYPRNFDKTQGANARRGLRGITPLGKKRVRSACWMLTKRHGRRRLTFSTVTLPELTMAQMSRVHKEWHRCIEFYRREMRRTLQGMSLSGEIVGVTEIQTERYEKSGLPILHAHFVFCGATSYGAWAVSPSRHDYIWRKSIENVLGESIGEIPSACQLKAVTTSAEAYLSKYMSKGSDVIEKVKQSGYTHWLPRQWWNCDRTLTQTMEVETIRTWRFAGWLVNRSEQKDCDMFHYFKKILVEREGENPLHMGYFGRLTAPANALIHKLMSGYNLV